MSDNALDPDLKERAELISGGLTTVLEEQGYAPAVAQAHKFFANCTPDQMEQMKPHFSSLAREFLVLAGFITD